MYCPARNLLFYNLDYVLGLDIKRSVVSTVAAIIGHDTEGLYLLTSIAIVVGVVRLAKKRTVVHEMACIETLAK